MNSMSKKIIFDLKYNLSYIEAEDKFLLSGFDKITTFILTLEELKDILSNDIQDMDKEQFYEYMSLVKNK